MTLALGFEIMLALLLLLTVIYCWRLEKRLNALRSGADGMRAAVQDLVTATGRAQACIEELRRATEQGGAELDSRMKSARQLAADLQRLERNARMHKPVAAVAPSRPRRSGLMDRLGKAG
ncbi:MAG TPA: hypothetical protein ENK41_03910 [Rhodobacteraceae bacterium]|nr:hypothetical protein [Paracoccaceae bacterium]